MYPCLAVRDIVDLICRTLVAKSGQQTVLNFALTCRDVCDIAMDSIWGTETITLVPILQCLFADCSKVVDRPVATYPNDLPAFPTEPNQHHLTRFEYYRHRIRSIYDRVGNTTRTANAHRFLKRLHMALQGPMFPGLRQLAVELATPGLEPFVHMLISPSVVNLMVYCIPNTKQARRLEDILSLIVQQRCGLDRLELTFVENGSSGSVDLVDRFDLDELRKVDFVISKAISSSPKLRIFTCEGMAPGPLTVEALAFSPSLEIWDFQPAFREEEQQNRTPEWLLPYVQYHFKEDAFPKLQLLMIKTSFFWDRSASLLQSICTGRTQLTRLIIKPQFLHIGATPNQVVEVLRSRLSLTASLRSLQLRGGYRPSSGLSSEEVEKLVEMLASLVHIENLNLFISLPTGVPPLHSISKSWTGLQSLIIDWGKSAPTITLIGFLPLLENCPRLKEIQMPAILEAFDIRLVPEGAINTQITKFGDGETRFSADDPEDVEGIVDCLMTMFPNLERVQSVYTPHANQYISWMKLQDMFYERQYLREGFDGEGRSLLG